MTGKKVFTCEICDRSIDVDSREKAIPECCGQPMMEALPVCTTTDTAEHARFNDSGEPCDDARGVEK